VKLSNIDYITYSLEDFARDTVLNGVSGNIKVNKAYH
jgi:hypothetical protein